MEQKSLKELDFVDIRGLYAVFGWVVFGPMIYFGGKAGVIPVLICGILLAALWVIAMIMLMWGAAKERREHGPYYHRGS